MTFSIFRPVLAVGLLGLLAACEIPGSIEQAAIVDIPKDDAAPGPTPALQAGCGWFESFVRPDQNYAFPDVAARYYLAAGPNENLQGKRLRIEGRFPDARYSSFHIYGGSGETYDHLADYQLEPDPGQANPFAGPARRSGANVGGRYTVTLNFGPAPARRPANTLYRAPPEEASARARQTFILYRVYTPPDGSGGDGGVGLPRLVLETAGGEIDLAQTPDSEGCATLRANVANFARDQSTPQLRPPTDPPEFEVYSGVLGGAAGGGIFRNEDVAYVAARLRKAGNDLVLVRGLAPRTVGSSSDAQLRYWSLCQNEFQSQAVIACVSDVNAVLDGDGHFNVVISADDKRPPQLNGFSWLPFGEDELGAFIYRHMLPAADFRDAVQRASTPQQMGAYEPQAVYCSLDTFNAAVGQSPAQVFAACEGETP